MLEVRKPRRVLVAEDEYFIARDLVRALRALAIEVVGPVAEVPEALLLARTEAVDAAILDINLHGQEIYPVADILRRRGVRLIFATGYGTAAIPQAYRGVPRWEKPFDPDRQARMIFAAT